MWIRITVRNTRYVLVCQKDNLSRFLCRGIDSINIAQQKITVANYRNNLALLTQTESVLHLEGVGEVDDEARVDLEKNGIE